MISPEPAPRSRDAKRPGRRGAVLAVVCADAMESEVASLLRNLEFSTSLVVHTADPRAAAALREAGVQPLTVAPESAGDHRGAAGLRAGAGGAVSPWRAPPPALKEVLDAQDPGTWVLTTHADERISAELREALVSLPGDGEDAIQACRIPVTRFVCGAYLQHGGWASRELRVFRRALVGALECGEPVPGTRDLEAAIVDLGHRRIDERLRWINRLTDLQSAGDVEPPRIPATLWAPLRRFFDIYGVRRGYRDGTPGLVAAALAAFETFLGGLKRWERRHPGRG